MSSENVENYVNGLKVVELREELKKRGVTSYGVKSVLAERLIATLKAEGKNDIEGDDTEAEEKDVEQVEPQPSEETEACVPSAHAQEREEDEVVAEPGDAESVEPAVQPADAQTEEQQVVLPNEEAKGEDENPEEQTTEDEEAVYVELPVGTDNSSTSDEQALPVPAAKETSPTPKEESEEEPMESSELDKQAETMEVLDSVEGEEPAEGAEGDKKEDRKRDRENDDDDNERGRGYKRDRNRDDRDRDRPKRFDPRHAADPEEPLHFNEEKMRLLVPKDFVSPDNDELITLDPYHSSLYFAVSEDGMSGCGLTEEGFQYLWAGSCASWGVKNGQYFFQCQIGDEVVADLPESEDSYHDVRVGWSVLNSDSTVGESRLSFAYCKNGSFVCHGRSTDYGQEYNTGDTITCCIDLTKSPGTVSFSKNGETQGTKEITVDSRDRGRKTFYPHVSVKNIKVSLDFGELLPSTEEKSEATAKEDDDDDDDDEKPVEKEEPEEKPDNEEESKPAEEVNEEAPMEEGAKEEQEEKEEEKEVETTESEEAKVDATEEVEKTMESSEKEEPAAEEEMEESEKETSAEAGDAVMENKEESSEDKPEESKEEASSEEVIDYKPIQQALADHKERAPRQPSSQSSCEIIFLIGLPAAGKTTWAQKFCRDQKEKVYEILGPEMILDKMGLGRVGWKENYETLLKQANEIVNNMLVLASESMKNFIIDQTNVYRSAQERKVGYFKGFRSKAVLVIPPHHELRRRRAERRGLTGYEVPENDLKAMKANFFIPRKPDGIFDDVQFSEIYGLAAEKIVSQYKDDALDVPYYPPPKRGRYDNRSRGGGGGGSSYYRPRPQYGGYHPPYGGHYGHPQSHYYPPPPPPRPYGGYHASPPARPYPQYHHHHHNSAPYMPRGGGGGGGGGGNRYSNYPSRQPHYGQPGPRGGYYNRY